MVYLGHGKVLEAKMHGAEINPLGKRNVVWNHNDRLDNQRDKIRTEALKLKGTPYGFLDIFVLGCSAWGIHSKWIDSRIERQDRLICSQLVDLAYKNAGVGLFDDNRLTCEVTPGDLAERMLKVFWDGTKNVSY